MIFNNLMKTNTYNPSPLEIEFANLLEDLTDEMNMRLKNRKIEATEIQLDQDNPTFRMDISDLDGDKHTMVIKIIQRPDQE